jgi:hypothetical protein
MAFDRKQYGMNSGIPFIKIADRVEVSVNLKVKRVSGPLVDLKRSAHKAYTRDCDRRPNCCVPPRPSAVLCSKLVRSR